MSNVTMVVVYDGLSCESQRQLQDGDIPYMGCESFFEVAGRMGRLNDFVLLVASAWAWSKASPSVEPLLPVQKVQRICWLQEPADMARLLTLHEKGWAADVIIRSHRQLRGLWLQGSSPETGPETVQDSGQSMITLEGCDVSSSEIEALLSQGLDDSKMAGGV